MNKETIKVSKTLIEATEFVLQYASQLSSWVEIKKEILKNLPINERSLFSTRDPITKKQRVNELEKILAKFWTSKTKKTLEMPDEE